MRMKTRLEEGNPRAWPQKGGKGWRSDRELETSQINIYFLKNTEMDKPSIYGACKAYQGNKQQWPWIS